MNPNELVQGAVPLVSLPEVCLRIGEMVEDPEVSASDLGYVISHDAGLTARLLKVVNSGVYGPAARVDTVSRAVAVLGLDELRGLVLAASVIGPAEGVPNELVDVAAFWRHSVYCGVLAELLAGRCGVLHSERLFVAGLLHDIGKLVLCARVPEAVGRVRARVQDQGIGTDAAERELLGFDHAEVGGTLLAQWNMPGALCDAVRFHHHPDAGAEHGFDACVIHIADALAGAGEMGLDDEQSGQAIGPEAWQRCGLDPAVAEVVLREAGPRFSQTLELILPRAVGPN